MKIYDEHINEIISELDRMKVFLAGLYSERNLIMKALLSLMLDQGRYDIFIYDYMGLDGYDFEYKVEEDRVKLSIIFPPASEKSIL